MPENSGLPRYSVPSGMPSDWSDRLVLFAVGQFLEECGRAQISVRTLATYLNRANSEAVGRRLRRLVSSGYLEVVKSHTRLSGRVYGKGPLLRGRTSLSMGFTRLMSALFGRHGLCGGFNATSAIGSGFLGFSGVLVMSVLRSASRPLLEREIKRYLRPLQSDQTTARALKKLQLHGIACEEEKEWAVSPSADVALEEYTSVSTGADERLRRTRRRFLDETAAYREVTFRDRLTARERLELRRQPCVKCGRVGDPKKMQVEHFPPRSWGGFDDVDLCFSICGKCNVGMSHWIEANKEAWLESRGTAAISSRRSFVLRKDLSHVERQRVLRTFMRTRLSRFYGAARRGRADDAFRAVSDGLMAWRAFIEGIPGYRVSRAIPTSQTRKRVIRGQIPSGRSKGRNSKV